MNLNFGANYDILLEEKEGYDFQFWCWLWYLFDL